MASPTTKRKIYLGCDGFGEDLKNAMKSYLDEKGDFEIQDFGTDTYFDIAGKVATAVVENTKQKEDGADAAASPVSTATTTMPLGLLVCGTGMGVGIVANKFPGVRAATVENIVAARCARAVNDANILCLGQLVTPVHTAKELVDAFLEQEFCHVPTIDDNGTTPAPWWNDQVESFLATSKDGIARVEQQAATASSGSSK